MLFEIFILIEILAACSFLLSWYGKNPITWALTTVLFGIQIITGFNIEFIVTSITDSGIIHQTFNHSSVISYVNMLFFGLALTMFIWDIFNQRL